MNNSKLGKIRRFFNALFYECLNSRYIHRCQACYYLGNYGVFDLYYCNKDNYESVIARYGNKPSEFISGFHNIDSNPHLNEIPPLRKAKELAIKKKLITGNIQ